jgi:hypothetical protein
MHPALAAAKAKLETRRANRPPHVRAGFVSSQHQNYGLAYAPAELNPKTGEPVSYFKIRYCRDCLKGTVIDMVRDITGGLDDARALGIRQQRPWRLECVARQQPTR